MDALSDYINWGIKGLFTILMLGGGWIMRQLRDDINQTHRELEDHKLYSANTYAKDMTIQSSLARVHDRVDSMAEQVEDSIKDVRNDIKQILILMKK